ncbi:AarF/UbiB family protein [Acanthopleuribacter pedis]|uniref:ABC1 atypical kinase-like domain-containing protein n=1 Tax=Acanthopleuribacter pedis TaxID=442870 RepID=A0A8J7U4C0_9BACT|nr:AarF/UbiB family protein [Acanthopleuribacter pedis]MBO1321333.1 hypothetical protein [Acanthopleuribacter pedis]
MQKSRFGRTLANAGLAREMVQLSSLEKDGDPEVLDRARRHLAQRMGGMRGLPQKIGQIFSLASSSEKAEAFDELNQGGQPLPLHVILKQLEKQWKQPWREVLEDIDPKGNAASLGQVHRATAKSFGKVAVKTAFPGIDRVLRHDLAAVKMAGKARNLIGGPQMDALIDELLSGIEVELDYAREARMQTRYRDAVSNPDHIVVPQCMDPLCGPSVLVTQWQEGATLAETLSWPQETRFQLALMMARHAFDMLFAHGLAHADPHWGNYRFREDPQQIVMFDFGSVLELNRQRRLALLGLIRATIRGSGDPLAWLGHLGFNLGHLLPMRRKLPHLCAILFEPFRNPAQYDTQTWHRNERLADLLGEDRWNFRMSAPGDIFFLVRSIQGLLFYLNRWQTKISWHLCLRPLLDRFASDLDAMEQGAVSDAGFESVARHLSMTLWRDGSVKVRLKFPADAVERLEQLVGEDIEAKIRAAGIDIKAVKRDARRRGHQPGTLVDYQDPNEDQRFVLALETETAH